MSCKYKNQCPSATGWCDGPRQDFSQCVAFLVTAYEELKRSHPPVLYLCAGLACERCSPECRHTSNIIHSKNFVRLTGGIFVEDGGDENGN